MERRLDRTNFVPAVGKPAGASSFGAGAQTDMIKYNVYVIIVTYNGEKWIKKCLDSIMCSTMDINIIVVDNASIDDTARIIYSYDKNVKFIPLSHNIGFGQANNVGLKYALTNNADYVLLLNQDAIISNDMLSCLIKVSEQYPEYGILSPMHYNYEGTRLDPGFIRYCPPDLLNDAFANNIKEIYDTKMVNAAVWFLKGEVLHSVGGFDPLFFHGGEDEDYVQRAIYFGYRIGIVSRSKAYHSHESFGYNHEFTIAEKSNYQYNRFILDLKNPENNFFGVLLDYIIKLLFSVIGNIVMFRFNNVKMKVHIAIRIMTRVHIIIKQRKMSINKIPVGIVDNCRELK